MSARRPGDPVGPGWATEVARAFAVGTTARLDGPVAQGVMGRVWRLTTEQGRFALKEPFFEVDPVAAEADARYQDRHVAAGHPLPPVIRTPEGRAIAVVRETPLRLYAWVDVLPADPWLDPAAVGELVGRLHKVVEPADSPPSSWYVDPVGAARWAEVAAGLRAAGAPFAEPLDRLVPELVALEEVLGSPPRDVRWCHLDLWADNLRATPDGGLMVLDWENAGPGDPSRELALVLVEFGRDDPDRIRRLRDAYEATGAIGRVGTPADFAALVATQGHMLELGSRRWLAATTADLRQRMEEWLDELLGVPITRETIRLVLDALGSPL